MSEKVDAIIKGIQETNQAIEENFAYMYDFYRGENGLTTMEAAFGKDEVADAQYYPTD